MAAMDCYNPIYITTVKECALFGRNQVLEVFIFREDNEIVSGKPSFVFHFVGNTVCATSYLILFFIYI